MSFLFRRRGARMALGLGFALTAGLAAPAACLFPDYSFDEPEPSGPGGNTTSQGGGGGGGMGPTTSSGGGAPTSSSSSTSTEDCTNGVDDDNNQLVDCEDPGCDAFACVPDVPADWTGFYALYDGPPAQDPGCPSEFPSTGIPQYLGNRGIMVQPAQCTCSCGGATGQACAALNTMQLAIQDAPCNGAPSCVGNSLTLSATPNTCTSSPYYPGGLLTCGPNASMTCDTQTGQPCNVSIAATALQASGGSCAANPVGVDTPDVTWTAFGRACGDASAYGQGCNIGQVCLPTPEAPFVSGVCVSKLGDNVCPPGAFTQKHLFYAGATDTRDCTNDCACGAPSGGTCPTTITIYSDPSAGVCNTQIAQFPAGSCANIAGNPNVAGRKASAPGAPTGATCQPSGGTPTGTATPQDPTTFCCIP